MSRIIGVVAVVSSLLAAAPALANDYRVRVHGGGTVVAPPRGGSGPSPIVRDHRRGGPVGVPGYGGPVYTPRPRVWVRGPSYYGYGYGYGYRYRPYYYYPYAYGYGYGYPYPASAYAVAAPAPGPTEGSVVAVAQPREPTIGVGVRGSAVRAGQDRPAAEGVGALLRFRARPVELELEVGWDRYGSDTDRRDTRLGTSLYVPIGGEVIVPYLVVGAGMNFARFGTTGDDLHQGYLAGGGGLALNFSRSFGISADARYMVREFFDRDELVAKQPLTVTPGVAFSKHDEALEFRANAVVYF
jgi:hypothetical protein